MMPTTLKRLVMTGTGAELRKNLRVCASLMAGLVLLAGLTACAGRTGIPEGQRSFTSPQQAVAALVAAVQENSDSELLAILGPEAKELISSGDSVADQNGRQRFLNAMEEQNRLESLSEDRMQLTLGSKDYPFPIPIVRLMDGWYFDTPAGKEEILDRRIGRNELHTIAVLQDYTDAQREYACRNGGSEFAQKLTSSEGTQDGLYWPVMEDGQESPLGPLIARAADEGYENGLDEEILEPFHGYLFRVLKAQGGHAAGGAFDYVVDGKMVLGFALVAYPAKYGASGIMTFIVNQEGTIYQQDLGEETLQAAQAINTFDPGPSWRTYQEPAGEE